LRSGGKPNEFDKFVRLFIYGDDSVIFWNKSHVDFNENSIAAACKELGLTIEFAHTLEFLGHYVTFNERYSRVVGALTYGRVLSALIIGDVSYDLDLTWQRACGIRISTFGNDEAYDLCDKYCLWMLRHYPFLEKSCYIPEQQLCNLNFGSMPTGERLRKNDNSQSTEAKEASEIQS
jgi:hypothetical protein